LEHSIFSDILLIISTVICGYLFTVSVTNYFLLREIETTLDTKLNSKVSILIPCRNEEFNVKNIVTSLVNQTYKNIEIILLDDCSDDNTRRIIFELSKKYSNVKAEIGLELQDGWIGKNWACHQLSRSATGDYLLFCDADVIYDKKLIQDTISKIERNDYKFLTLFPGRKSYCLTDKFIWSFAGWAVNAWIPFLLTFKTKFSFFAAGFGQFLMINKKTYINIGGHESFKGTQLDDFELARLIQKSGNKWYIGIASNRIQTNGYNGFFESINGHGRSIMPVFRNNGIIMLLFWFVILNTVFFPIINFVFLFVSNDFYFDNVVLSILNILFVTFSWILTAYKTKVSFIPSLLYPITTVLILFVALHSFYRTKKRIIFWKDRLIS